MALQYRQNQVQSRKRILCMKIELDINVTSSYCDDCGHITYATGVAKMEGVVIAEVSGDDHLGGGPTDEREIQNYLLRQILNNFGYVVESKFTYDDDGLTQDYLSDLED